MHIGNGPHLGDISDDFLLNHGIWWGEIADEYLGFLRIKGLDFFLWADVLAG